MVGKRVLKLYVWECRGNGVIDLGENFGDEMRDLKTTGIFLISLLGAEIRIYPEIPRDVTACWETIKGLCSNHRVIMCVCRSTLIVLIYWYRLWSENVFGVSSAVRASKLLDAERY
ncbi:hypothetical protein AVEN_49202-1 [Araneus ventricosus]|uniref:Uncharacterized protein n=1 Tax=Araneus ventricosus TaxID=182803 RepID=A0A4Y2KQ78_ARAVE|nr:hypothetical protein AVEN_49202-1 [Araneus ventricosus]